MMGVPEVDWLRLKAAESSGCGGQHCWSFFIACQKNHERPNKLLVEGLRLPETNNKRHLKMDGE